MFPNQRRLLSTPLLLAGGLVALLIFLPNLIWNIEHHLDDGGEGHTVFALRSR